MQVLRTKTICGLVSEKLVLWCDALFKKVTIMFSSHGNRTEVFNQILLKGEKQSKFYKISIKKLWSETLSGELCVSKDF